MNKNNFKPINLFRGYGRLKEESLYPSVGIIKNFNIVAELEEENEHLKNNWNKLKEFIKKAVDKYYDSDLRIELIYENVLNKMQEIEEGDSNG